MRATTYESLTRFLVHHEGTKKEGCYILNTFLACPERSRRDQRLIIATEHTEKMVLTPLFFPAYLNDFHRIAADYSFLNKNKNLIHKGRP